MLVALPENPQPQTLDQVRKDLLEALGAKEVPLDKPGFALTPPYLWITNSVEAIEALQRMIDEASDKAA